MRQGSREHEAGEVILAVMSKEAEVTNRATFLARWRERQ